MTSFSAVTSYSLACLAGIAHLAPWLNGRAPVSKTGSGGSIPPGAASDSNSEWINLTGVIQSAGDKPQPDWMLEQDED